MTEMLLPIYSRKGKAVREVEVSGQSGDLYLFHSLGKESGVGNSRSVWQTYLQPPAIEGSRPATNFYRLNDWPGVQASSVALRSTGPLLAVHHVPEVEQVGGGLPEERARGMGLRAWGPLFHDRGW